MMFKKKINQDREETDIEREKSRVNSLMCDWNHNDRCELGAAIDFFVYRTCIASVSSRETRSSAASVAVSTPTTQVSVSKHFFC